MISDEEMAWGKHLADAIGGAQARNTVHHYILREIAIELAKQQPDPERYLASMFERVSRLLDQGEVETRTPDVMSEMRWVTESFFARAGQAVRGRPD